MMDMKRKPNILVFMTDQQLSDTILPNNPTKTPNVDKFRQRAVQFTDAYCPAPHCCPSRATFFTGLYPSEHNIWHNVEVCNAISRKLFDGITMFPQELQKAGYQTYFSGKWHVSGEEGPRDRGFDEVLNEVTTNYGRSFNENIAYTQDWDIYYSDKTKIDYEDSTKEFGRIIRQGYPTYYQFGVEVNPFGDSDTVAAACDKIISYHDEHPFFMYVGTTGPHDPYNPPQEFLDLYEIENIQLPDTFEDLMLDAPALYRRTRDAFKLTEEEHKESLRRYMAFCSYEDALFGKLVDTLTAKGIMEETIIIYLSDHGDYAGAHGLWAKGLPCYREAYHICAMVGGGGITGQSQVNHELVSLADFAPTILDLAEVKTNLPFAGRSLVPFLFNQAVTDWRTEIYTQTNGNEIYGIQRAVWNKKWKYIFNSFDYDQLYDLEHDVGETKNLINQPDLSPVVKEMCKKLWQFAKEHKDSCTCPYIMVALAPYGPGILLE